VTTPPEDVIDSHHHLWDPEIRAYPWLEEYPAINRAVYTSDLSVASAASNVAGTIVVEAISTSEETDWLLELADDSDLVVGVVGWVDLQDAAVGDRLAELSARSSRLVGIRHPAQDEADSLWLTRPAVRRGMRAVQKAGLPFDLLVRHPQREAALMLADSHPDMTFVLDHLGKPRVAAGEWDEWLEWLTALSLRPNVYCKVSGLVTEASWATWRVQRLERYVHAAVEIFGAERCMFGSDWPVSLLAAGYTDVIGLVERATEQLSGTERHLLFHGTATSVYGLVPPDATS
jgi:L-fuconolactonase